MFRFENARRQRFGRVFREHRHLFLRENLTTIENFVHQVHRHTRLRGAARQHRCVHAMPVHPRAPEIGQQGRVDVDHAAAKPGDHWRRDKFQVASQHHELRIPERREQLGGVPRITKHNRRDAGATRALQGARLRAVRDHARDTYYGRGVKRVEEGLQVRAAARHEHGDTNRQRGHWLLRLQRTTDFGFEP